MIGQAVKSKEQRLAIILFLCFLLCGLAVLLFVLVKDASAELTAKANHDYIKIDFFYHGSTVSVSGLSEPGTDLVIKITSADGHQALKKRGKMAGLLWMNVGELKYEHVPHLYSLHSTGNIDELLSREERDKYIIGYPALERHIEIEPVKNAEEKNKWFNEFIKFKEDQKLYATSLGNISLSKKDGKQNYYILTQWPHQAPPGDYLVTVYAVRGKKVVEKAEAKVRVEQTGIVKTLFDMSKNNGGLYGILSIAVALGAGFGVGMIFRKGGGAH